MKIFAFISISLLLNILFSSPVLSQGDGTITLRISEASRPHSIDILPPFQLIGAGSASVVQTPTTAVAEKGRIWLRPRVRKDYKTPEYSQTQIYCALTDFSIKEINGKGVSFSSANGSRKYHGIVSLSYVRDGSIDMINKVSKRDYVAGVVCAESPPNASYEMIRAQAVLVQTSMFRQKGALIGDSIQSQYYLGCSNESLNTRSAIASVWGEKLYYKNLPITVYYHSTCAGGTSNGATYFQIKNANVPYLAPVACKNCSTSPFWKPTIKEISADRFASAFGVGLPEITKKDYTDRPLAVKLADGKTITGYDFWIMFGKLVGRDKAPGTRFSLKTGENGNIIVESTGAGHGIGLCQWGANELAKKGKSYQEILRYYYPGCIVR